MSYVVFCFFCLLMPEIGQGVGGTMGCKGLSWPTGNKEEKGLIFFLPF